MSAPAADVTTLVLTYSCRNGEDGVTYTTEIRRHADTFTRQQILSAFEDLLRGAGYDCPPDALGVETPRP